MLLPHQLFQPTKTWFQLSEELIDVMDPGEVDPGNPAFALRCSSLSIKDEELRRESERFMPRLTAAQLEVKQLGDLCRRRTEVRPPLPVEDQARLQREISAILLEVCKKWNDVELTRAYGLWEYWSARVDRTPGSRVALKLHIAYREVVDTFLHWYNDNGMTPPISEVSRLELPTSLTMRFARAAESRQLEKGQTVPTKILFEIAREIGIPLVPRSLKNFTPGSTAYQEVRQLAAVHGYKRAKRATE
ncbi:MAG: hypothetical protein WB626_05050 [Bacteroidota bacterium]